MRIHLFLTLVLFLMVDAARAQTQQPLRVLASNGMQAVINELRPRIEKELGRSLNIEFGTSVAIRQRIESGEAFDATVLTSEVVNALAKAGKIDAKSVTELGRSGIGFGVKAGAPEPDVKTPEAVKKTLLNAKSLTWVSIGASRATIDKMTDALGISSEVKAKTVLTQGLDESLALITSGKNEMILTLTSEIMPAKGLKYVGPFPERFQNYVTFSAGVGPKASVPAAAALFIKQLTVPQAANAYRAKGMEMSNLKAVRPVK